MGSPSSALRICDATLLVSSPSAPAPPSSEYFEAGENSVSSLFGSSRNPLPPLSFLLKALILGGGDPSTDGGLVVSPPENADRGDPPSVRGYASAYEFRIDAAALPVRLSILSIRGESRSSHLRVDGDTGLLLAARDCWICASRCFTTERWSRFRIDGLCVRDGLSGVERNAEEPRTLVGVTGGAGSGDSPEGRESCRTATGGRSRRLRRGRTGREAEAEVEVDGGRAGRSRFALAWERREIVAGDSHLLGFGE